jgi:hypothetical protein
MGATAGVRTVDEVTTELTPSDDDVLEGWKPGKCDGPTFINGGRCGSGASTGVGALVAV